MKLTHIKTYLHDYGTEDATNHGNGEVVTDDPRAFVREEEERHGENFAGYQVIDSDVSLCLYQNVIGGADDGK